jgi:glyoxylase-like metal-dependent hydrolase (beta-lactamase superfamily II)
MIFEQVLIGGDRNFAYLAGCPSGVAAVFDPSYDPLRLVAMAEERGLRITHLFNTHGHEDHVNGNDALVRATGARVCAHPGCPVKKDLALADDEEVVVGSLRVRCIFTPGHTRDSVTFLLEDVAVTGDLLFVGKVGGTRTEEEAREEYESLHRRLLALPDETKVYPGHNYGVRPNSTLGRERRENPFLLQRSFEEFLALKRNWAEYKKAHGIP